MKTRKMGLLALTLPMAVGASAIATAGDLPSREEMWQIIQKQQRELDALKTQVGQPRSELSPAAVASPVAEAAKEAAKEVTKESGKEPGKESGKEQPWPEKIKFSGLIKVDAMASGKDIKSNTRSSDVYISEAHLTSDATINEWTKGHIQFIYEKGVDDGPPADKNRVRLDEATITLGNTERFPVFLTAGRMIAPLSTYTSNLIDDPLTLTLARSKETVGQVGFESNGFYGSGWIFNGDVNRTGQPDTASQGGGNLGYKLEDKGRDLKVDVGLGYTNSLDDSGTLSAIPTVLAGVKNHIGAVGAHATVNWNNFAFIGEYVAATDTFQTGELAYNGRGARPKAWNAELGYTYTLLKKDTTFSVAYQGTREALAAALPEKRYLAGITIGIFDHTNLQFQYYRDKDYSIAVGGTNRSVDVGKTQLVVDF
ncbi:MAG: LbtU family siderophore porin [Magnetococcales bacterium]|nr:LbtU family siderophore porin [Magnetococcales bacterium]